MIKKSFAFIIITFIIASTIFKNIPAKADAVAIDPMTIFSLFDIGYGTACGFEYDFSNYDNIQDFIDQYNSKAFGEAAKLIQQNQIIAAIFEQSGYNAENIFTNVYSSIFRMNPSLWNALQKEYSLLGQYSSIPFTIDGIRSWNQYSYNFASKYLDLFREAVDSIDVYPDANYLNYIDTINGTGFYISNYNNGVRGGSNGYMQQYYPNFLYSWTTVNGNLWGSNGNGSPLVSQGDITTANIIGENDNYSCTITLICHNGFNGFYGSENNYYTGQIRTNFFDGQTNIIVGENQNYTTNGVITRTYTGSLSQIFTNIAKSYRNINIYVNGVAWSIVSAITPTDVVSLPDANVDNDLVSGQDVIVPKQDLAFDLLPFLDLIEDAIENNRTIDWDDLIDSGVIIDDNGEAIDDESDATDTVPISDVIDNTYEDENITPTPDPEEEDNKDNNKDPAPVPPVPPIPDPFKTPTDDDPIGVDPFGGVTVLSRIINVTNQSLPSELMTVFWGIIAGMIILGIIKILHK